MTIHINTLAGFSVVLNFPVYVQMYVCALSYERYGPISAHSIFSKYPIECDFIKFSFSFLMLFIARSIAHTPFQTLKSADECESVPNDNDKKKQRKKNKLMSFSGTKKKRLFYL